jgi:hypothetical protein
MWGPIPPHLNTDFQEHINKFRSIVPKVVSKAQLYSLFVDRQSHVDYQLEKLVSQGDIKVLEGGLVIRTCQYVELVNDQIVANADNDDTVYVLEKMRDWTQTTIDTIISKKSLAEYFSADQVTRLVTMGYYSLIPTDLENMALSIPRVGFIVRLQQLCETHIVRTLNSTKWKEMTESELLEKWLKNKARFKDFKGLSLNWCLHHLVGQGVIEVFQTGNQLVYKIV